MADTHRIVRSLMTVFVDTTGTEPFDPVNLQPVALAQTYNLTTAVATQNLVANDLADPSGAAEWVVPEPTEKSWTLSADSLVLVEDAVNPNYDPTGKVIPSDILDVLIAGNKIFVALMDSTAASGDTIPQYGTALITGFDQSGSIDEYHTWSLTATGLGPINSNFVWP